MPEPTPPSPKTIEPTLPFRPFEAALDRDAALALVRKALSSAEDGELFLERFSGESLVLDDRRLRQAAYEAHEGFGLRAVRGTVTAYAHSSELGPKPLARASETVARALRAGGGGSPAEPPAPVRAPLYRGEDPALGFSFAKRVELLKEIDDHLRAADPRVVQVTVGLATALQEIAILRGDGQLLSDTRPMARLTISVIVEGNGRRETGSAGGGGRVPLAELVTPDRWKAQAAEALRIATTNLSAEPAPAGVFDVVLGPGWPGILLHEAVGHGLEADFNRKGSSAFARLIGERVAAPGVTVVDDGTLPGMRGSITIDDEGTPSSRTVLIEDGILLGYLYDRQNARLMGAKPTGNGRRQSYAHAPMPRMTNTYMLAGQADPADLVAAIDDGLWAVGFGGGQVDITSGKFVFSCTESYRVKKGRVLGPVKGATLIGDGPTALRHIRGIGRDFALDPGQGTCGKAGQWVPVGVGQPSLLIGNLTVGGTA